MIRPKAFENLIYIVGAVGFASFWAGMLIGYVPLFVLGMFGVGLYMCLLLINVALETARDIKASFTNGGIDGQTRVSIVVGLIIAIGAACVLYPTIQDWLLLRK